MDRKTVKGVPFSYGWIIVFVFLVSGIAIYGVRFSYGIFFKSLESEFNLTRAATSSILSFNLAVSGISAYLMGWALDRFGPKSILALMGLLTSLGLIATGLTNYLWQLYLSYSVLLAMGIGAVFVVPMATISRWFDRKRGLAAGIASAGIGLGPLIIAPFATYMLLDYGWRMAFIVIGLIALLVIVPVAQLLKPNPVEHGITSDTGRTPRDAIFPRQHSGLSLGEAVRTRSFYMILLIYVFFSSNIFFVTTHIVPSITDAGFSAIQAATILSVIGVAAIAGRVLMGVVSDKVGRRFAVITCALLQSAAVFWLAWTSEYWMLVLFAVIFGTAYSGMSPSMAALISNSFGTKRIGSILGILEIGFGLGAAIGPTIGGYVFDTTGSYDKAFFLWTAAMLIAALVTFLVRREY